MKASKFLSLFLIAGTSWVPFGYCSETSKKEDVCDAEQKAIEVIKTSKDMDFLLKAQQALEIRKYDLYNSSRDQLPNK